MRARARVSRAPNDGKPAGQRRAGASAGRKAISTRYLLRVDTGFLVRKCWEWTGFSPGAPREPDVSLGVPDFFKESVTFALEFSKQVQRLVMVDFPRALPTQTLTWSQIEFIIYCLNLSITNR